MEEFEEEDEACEPEIEEREDKFHSADFNCNTCGQTDCFYWHIYNPDEENCF